MFIYLLDVWIDYVLLSYGQHASGMKAIKILNLCHGEDRLRFHLIVYWQNEEWLFWTVLVRKTITAAQIGVQKDCLDASACADSIRHVDFNWSTF